MMLSNRANLLSPPQTPLQHLPADPVPDGPPGLVNEVVLDGQVVK